MVRSSVVCCVLLMFLSTLGAEVTYDCSVAPGRGMPLGQFGDGAKAASGHKGGFCPAEKRCKPDAAASECTPEFGYGGARVLTWGSSFKDQLDGPVALAFRPGKPCELWIANRDNSSVSIVFNPGSTSKVENQMQQTESRQDIAGCHFHQKPMSISFGGAPPEGDLPRFEGYKFEGNETFLTTSDARNSYDGVGKKNVGKDYYGIRYGDDFAGPTLWSASLSEFAVKANDVFPGDLDVNPDGSHLSMLHQSSHSMGSVWAGREAAYWLWDGGVDSWLGSIVLADFKQTHGFGGSDHTKTIMFRYSGMHLKALIGVPGHMALGGGNWLYVCDPGNGRLVRMDTSSGTVVGDAKPRNEWREFYRNYSRVEGAKFETLNLPAGTKPSGLVYVDGHVYISDAATGDILLVAPNQSSSTRDDMFENADLSTWVVRTKVATAAKQIAGMALDAHRRLWFVDRATSKLKVVEPRCIDESACVNRAGGSPWAMACEAPKSNDGKNLYKSLQDKNVETWGYSVLDMGGCARSFYAACPGGAEFTRPVCESEGGSLGDACVTWTFDGPSCTCDGRCRRIPTFTDKVLRLFYSDPAGGIWFILAPLGGILGILALCCSIVALVRSRRNTHYRKTVTDEEAGQVAPASEGQVSI